MNYLAILTPAAEAAIWPLARKAAALEKQLAEIQRRAAGERQNIASTEARLEELKADAGERLTESAQSYGRFKTELRTLTARLETLREAVRMFNTELIPRKTGELAEARRAVEDALIGFVGENLTECERRMGELLGTVLAERDSFMVAVDAIATRYMGHELAGNKRTYPEPMHLRPDVYRPAMLVATTLNEAIFDSDAPRRRGAYLTPPPAPVTAPEAPQDVQACAGGPPTPALDATGRPTQPPGCSGQPEYATGKPWNRRGRASSTQTPHPVDRRRGRA